MFSPAPTGAHRRDLSPDTRGVTRAADVLGCSVFDVFRLAHRQWFGAEPDAHRLEPVFVRYLATGTAPSWVRHFFREINGMAVRGPVDRTAFGLAPGPRPLGPDELDAACRWGVAAALLAWGIFACFGMV